MTHFSRDTFIGMNGGKMSVGYLKSLREDFLEVCPDYVVNEFLVKYQDRARLNVSNQITVKPITNAIERRKAIWTIFHSSKGPQAIAEVFQAIVRHRGLNR